MRPIRAIETRYRGYRFRSRLEARWAVFFDALGTPWMYEPEGFDINGTWYLPDFWLPALQCYAEVKPTTFTHQQFRLAEALGCILLEGPPEVNLYVLAHPTDRNTGIDPYIYYTWGKLFFAIDLETSFCINKAYYPVNVNSFAMEYSWSGMPPLKPCLRDKTLYAVHRARSARFEYGERG